MSGYSWRAGRRQQPLVSFNEIKACPALCLGRLFLCENARVGGGTPLRHRRANLTKQNGGVVRVGAAGGRGEKGRGGDQSHQLICIPGDVSHIEMCVIHVLAPHH